MRLKLKLQEFDYTIVYKKGKENGNCDVLSRIYSDTEPEEAIVNALTQETENIGAIAGRDESGDTREEGESETAYTDLSDKEKLEILKEIHDSPIGGHVGIMRTYQKLKQFINWRGMKNDVENYIKKCKKCQTNKMTQCHTRMPLTLTDTPSTVFEKASIDLIGPFHPSNSCYRYILTV
jgi:hypothetical protein